MLSVDTECRVQQTARSSTLLRVQEFPPFTSRIYLMVCLPSLLYICNLQYANCTCFPSDLLRLSVKAKTSHGGPSKPSGRFLAVGRPAGCGAMSSRRSKGHAAPGDPTGTPAATATPYPETGR